MTKTPLKIKTQQNRTTITKKKKKKKKEKENRNGKKNNCMNISIDKLTKSYTRRRRNGRETRNFERNLISSNSSTKQRPGGQIC